MEELTRLMADRCGDVECAQVVPREDDGKCSAVVAEVKKLRRRAWRWCWDGKRSRRRDGNSGWRWNDR